jgi:hypothetical protein
LKKSITSRSREVSNLQEALEPCRGRNLEHGLSQIGERLRLADARVELRRDEAAKEIGKILILGPEVLILNGGELSVSFNKESRWKATAASISETCKGPIYWALHRNR